MLPKTKIIVLLLSATFVAYGLVGGMWSGVSISAPDNAYQGLTTFTEVLSKVKEDYVEEPDLEKAMSGALHGMMEALDPYSSFIDNDTYQRIQRSKAEAIASPGVILSKRYGYVYVVSVVPGSSGHLEGLKSGDLIESIEGRMTTRMSLWEARKLFLGERGSTVSIRVVRGRRSKPAEIDLVRENPIFSDVSTRMVEDGVGFLKIPHLQEGVSKSVVSNLKILQSIGIRALVVDLRGTAVGEVEEAVRVSDLFLPKGKKIFTLRDRGGDEVDYLSTNDPIVVAVPMMLIVDGGTSGMAEIFVAALLDHKVAGTVGEKTNGEGSLQEIFHLKDGSVLQISTKLFYRPDGRVIQARKLRDSGVTPDVRSPSQEFITSFYFENTDGGMLEVLEDGFYQKLKDAVEAEQFKEALRQIRRQLDSKAA